MSTIDVTARINSVRANRPASHAAAPTPASSRRPRISFQTFLTELLNHVSSAAPTVGAWPTAPRITHSTTKRTSW